MKIQLPFIIAGAALLIAVNAGATTLDLTGGTSSGTFNGALFVRTDAASTGTGVIESFVRISGNELVVDGYNASDRPVMSEVNTSPTFTKDIQLSAFGEQTIAGLDYYIFLLDINQTGVDPILSLDQVKIYTRATAINTLTNGMTDAQILAAMTSTSTLVYNMDLGDATNTVLLNYNLNSGSGSGDMFLYVLKSAFGAETDYVYLYSEFGATGDHGNNDGFEEWATKEGITQVPDGGSMAMLLGMGLMSVAALRRKLGN